MSLARTCGCCAGVHDATPLLVDNRPGLSAIAYRIGGYPEFLESMLAGLTAAERPALAALATRDTDDFTLGILDAWAVVADVLTFYTERLANEAYLRTATDRISIQELGRLVGYRLRPGVAAQAHLAFALETPPSIPAATAAQPGAVPAVTPAVVHLDAGLRVQSIPGPGEKPQTFETIEAIDARPEWNALPASTAVAFTPQFGDTHAWLAGSTLNLTAGDVLLLAGSDVLGEQWDVRVLTDIKPSAPDNRTYVQWAEGLGSVSPPKLPAAEPKPYVLRKRVNIFGYNAPMWGAMSRAFRHGYPGGSNKTEWPNFTISGAPGTVVDLDGSHPDIVSDSWLVLSRPNYRELWKVQQVTELSRAEFAISGKVTRVTLTGGENYSLFQNEVRDTTVYAVSEPLDLAEGPDTSAVQLAELTVDGDASAMQPGRSLIVRGTTVSGADQAEVVLVKHVTPAGKRTVIDLDGGLSHIYRRDTVVVYGNVAPATHGETVQEVLGSGDAMQPFQRFVLAQSPLTYVQSSKSSGIDTTLEVRVNDVRWQEVPTLFGARTRDRAYSTDTDERGAEYVEFGDGQCGARLPTGSHNVRAKYRKGLGSAGNVRAGALSQLIDRPLGAKGVTNPLAADGGADPDSIADARESVPLATRTLGRAVSLLDYQDFARAFVGVTKAHAAVVPLRAGRTIVVTVVIAGGDERVRDLADALHKYGDPYVEIAVVQYREQIFHCSLRVAVLPDYDTNAVLAKVADTLHSAYGFDARELGQPVYRSELMAVVHRVAGVAAVGVDALYTGAIPARNERLIADQPAAGVGGVALGAGLVLIDPAPPAGWLTVMT